MDDQQAREAAAKAVEAAWGNPNWDGTTLRPIDRTLAKAAIDAYLAALPVTPEQPTQASGFWDSPAGHVLAVLRAEVGGWSRDTLAARKVIDLIDSLVSSPSELSAAPKETVTPAREAILRETIIREVLDWIAARQVQPQQSRVVARAARDHFGVSS